MEKKKEIKKQYFDVIVEALVPSKIVYRIFAETPEEALKLSEKTSTSPKGFTPNIRQHKRTKVTIKNAGMLNIKLTKSYK
jgi:hypothetical protein